MEDFLKNRPVLDPKSALVVAADPKPHASPVKPPVAPDGQSTATNPGPFGEIRSAGIPPKPAGRPGAPAVASENLAAAAAAQNLKGEHGTRVQTVVERGRVTKIIVTCTCGKVTEIACQY